MGHRGGVGALAGRRRRVGEVETKEGYLESGYSECLMNMCQYSTLVYQHQLGRGLGKNEGERTGKVGIRENL